MYFRLAPRKHGDVTYTYLQLVEAYREDGKNRQRVLYSFGNVEELREDGQLSRLVDSLQRATGCGGAAREPGLDALQTERVLEYGGPRLAQALWEQFGLTDLLRQQLAGRRLRFDAISAIATIVFNRLLAPRSELGIFAWRDRNWWPEFAATTPDLPHLYRALDALLEIKQPLEQALFRRLQHLFNLQVDVVFYDLTSSYFEGDGPPLARYGYSRDKRPDRKQVLLALACEEHGFPIAHEVLAGNRADSTTVQDMVAALQERFSLRRVIFVSDSGMVSQANLQALDAAGYEYLVAVRKRNVSDAERHAPADLATYEEGPHKVRVFVSEADTPGARYVCCWSEARAEEERQIRDARLAKGQAALQKLADQVAAGRLKCATKIAARAATALQRAQARSYFCTEATEGRFEFALNDEQLAKQQRLEGRYFLLTNAAKLTAPEAVEAYFTLQEVERAFREMKDFLKLRPIYHWTDRRVQAHIFACVLAYLLERSLSYQLRAAGVELSARKALDFASRIHAVENAIGEQTLWTVSRPTPQAQQVLKAVGIERLPAALVGYQPPDDD
jgi:transposase